MTGRERKRMVGDGGGEKLLSRRNVMAILERRLQNCGRLNIRCHVNESLSTAARFAYGADNASTFFETNYEAVIVRYSPRN